MEKDTWIGKKGYRYWYYKFRDSEYYGLAIIGFTLLVCIILLFNIIIPELTRWFSIRDEIVATRQRIATLQQNINFINGLDQNTLQTQFNTVSHALPPTKNFGYMLNALSNAAANSGVSLSDYAFQLGTITPPKKGQKDPGAQPNGISAIEITVVVNGNLEGIKDFIKSIQNNLPISEVTNINGTGDNVSVKLKFYQKPFNNITFSGDTPLNPISPKKAELLKTMAKWDNTSVDKGQSTQSGSGSAVPLF